MDDHYEIQETGVKVLLDDLGIRTDLDLRSNGKPVLDQKLVQWIQAPIEAYDAITDHEWVVGYRTAFKTLADSSNYPILVHCWGGADRTGTLMFLLGGLLGMKWDDLVRDYELTSRSAVGTRSHLSEDFTRFAAAIGSFKDDSADQNFQGIVERYLLWVGLDGDDIRSIRSILL